MDEKILERMPRDDLKTDEKGRGTSEQETEERFTALQDSLRREATNIKTAKDSERDAALYERKI